jgi:hypothetical protein
VSEKAANKITSIRSIVSNAIINSGLLGLVIWWAVRYAGSIRYPDGGGLDAAAVSEMMSSRMVFSWTHGTVIATGLVSGCRSDLSRHPPEDRHTGFTETD